MIQIVYFTIILTIIMMTIKGITKMIIMSFFFISVIISSIIVFITIIIIINDVDNVTLRIGCRGTPYQKW